MAKKRLNKGEIGERIALAIAQSGRRAKDIAGALGVTEVTISKYVHGVSTPKNAYLVELARELGVSVSWLLGEGEAAAGEETFPENLRRLMRERKLSQTALARAADVRQSALSAYLAGEGEPSAAALCRIARALGVTMDELYTGKRSVGKFPDKLRQIIKESGKTQKAVAREAGITEVTLSRWVKGQRTPRQEDFAKLARVLPVTLEMLKESAEDREPEGGRQELSAEESLERLREALRFVADFIEQKR